MIDRRPVYGPPEPETDDTGEWLFASVTPYPSNSAEWVGPKLNNFARCFQALDVKEWEVDEHNTGWWARAMAYGEELIVHGHPSSTSALESLLLQISALV